MTYFVILVFAIYFLLMIFLIAGLISVNRRTAAFGRPNVAVIVPVRNEIGNIGSLLTSLLNQNYPEEKFELLIVNDHSSDTTAKAIEERFRESGREKHKLINLNDTTGKKAAIEMGIEKATADIIIITDADCAHPPTWLQSITGPFENTQIKMVLGAVRIEASSLFGLLQQHETAALIGVGASTLALGFPTMCNGANLAFRKEAFLQVGGYEGYRNIASGDDEHLLRKAFNNYPKGVFFNFAEQSVVTTKASTSWKEFFNQRIRWASKWRSHGFGFSSLLAAFIFVCHLTFIGAAILAGFGWLPLYLTILLIGIKFVLEGVFLFLSSQFLKAKFNVLVVCCLQVIYSPYVVFFGLAANILRPTWKNRKI